MGRRCKELVTKRLLPFCSLSQPGECLFKKNCGICEISELGDDSSPPGLAPAPQFPAALKITACILSPVPGAAEWMSVTESYHYSFDVFGDSLKTYPRRLAFIMTTSNSPGANALTQWIFVRNSYRKRL